MLEDIDYYPQVFLQDCRYTFFASNKLIHEALDFTDSEPESEFEEEFNEDAAALYQLCIVYVILEGIIVLKDLIVYD